MFLIERRFCILPSVLTYDVTFLRHVTSNKMKKIEKMYFFKSSRSKVKLKVKVKGQGHLEIFTILYVINVIWFIYEKWKSACKIVNVQPILPKIDTHNAWTYPMECAKNWTDPKNVTYVSMATKIPIPIIKHREFLHISMCYISAIYEHIASKLTPVMQGSKWRILESQMTLKCQGQGQTYREPGKSPFKQ